MSYIIPSVQKDSSEGLLIKKDNFNFMVMVYIASTSFLIHAHAHFENPHIEVGQAHPKMEVYPNIYMSMPFSWD